MLQNFDVMSWVQLANRDDNNNNNNLKTKIIPRQFQTEKV